MSVGEGGADICPSKHANCPACLPEGHLLQEACWDSCIPGRDPTFREASQRQSQSLPSSFPHLRQVGPWSSTALAGIPHSLQQLKVWSSGSLSAPLPPPKGLPHPWELPSGTADLLSCLLPAELHLKTLGLKEVAGREGRSAWGSKVPGQTFQPSPASTGTPRDDALPSLVNAFPADTRIPEQRLGLPQLMAAGLSEGAQVSPHGSSRFICPLFLLG